MSEIQIDRAVKLDINLKKSNCQRSILMQIQPG